MSNDAERTIARLQAEVDGLREELREERAGTKPPTATDGKPADRVLAETLATMKAILDHAPILISTKDLDGVLTSANARFEVLAGPAHQDFVGRSVFDLFPTEVAKELWRNDLEARKGPIEVEESLEHRDGTVHTYWTTKFPLIRANGEVFGTGAISADLTERKHLEHQLLHAQKMEAVGALAGGVAHDMNNMLAVIMGFSSLLKQQAELDGQDVPDLDEILAAAKRGKVLIQHLLGFARKGAYQRQPTDLNQMAQRLNEILSRTLIQGVSLELDLDPELRAVHCDESQMTQVLMNLCLNARDAVDGSGKIEIRSRVVQLQAGEVGQLARGTYVRLQVKDDGTGMEEQVRIKAFEPFFTTKRVGKGTGLGLSMAYGVVANHGGVIEIESTPGQGTTLSLWLPALEEVSSTGSQQIASRVPSDPVIKPGAGHVLLVDDEELIRATGKRLLGALGYRVTVVAGGADGLEVYARDPRAIDLVLLDLGMPDMNGQECFRRLRSLDPGVRVLLCTGNTDPQFVDELLDAGALGVVTKPFDVNQLTEAVAEILQD